MGYKEQFDKAKEDNKVQKLTPKWIEFKEAGTTLCGQIVAYSEVESSLGSGKYHQYLMKTDEGLVKFALGSAADRELLPLLNKTSIYYIEYTGKEDIPHGKRVNKFIIERYDAGLAAVEFPKDDIPF